MRKLLLVFLMLSFLILLLPSSTLSSSSQMDEGDNTEGSADKRQYYECGLRFEEIQCEPLRNIIVNNFDGIARMIYDPSKLVLNETISGSISTEPRASSRPGIPNNEWQFIIATWDGTSLKLYRNGILEDSSVRIGSLVEPILAQIGGWEQQSVKGDSLKGDMDEIRMYNRALTEHEIAEILTGSDEVRNGMIGHWTFDTDTKDVSGNENHGTYKGNNLEFVDGIIGNALRFDGDDYIDIPSLPALSNALSFTSWIKLNSGTLDHDKYIFNNNQFAIRIDPQLEAPNRLAAFITLIADRPNVYEYSYQSLLVSMDFASDGRLFFTEKNTGNVRILQDDEVLESPFVSISHIYARGESGLLGLILDPRFNENHFVYVYYTYLDDKTGQPFNRIVRFTDDNNRGTDMKILLDRIPANDLSVHSGGALAFGPDEKLYITVGDNLTPESSQDPTILTGKVLRINKDGTIPNDNPWLWDNNPSRVYNNAVLDENFICAKSSLTESGLKVCNFYIQNNKNDIFVVEKDFNVKHTNLTSIKITINNPSSEASLYNDYRRDISNFMSEGERDWSAYTYLTFWLNGSENNSILGVKLRDSEWDDHDEEYLIYDNFTGWKSFMIPLRETFYNMNFSSVRGIEFVFHKGWDTTINIDALYLANSDDPFTERKNYSYVSPVYTIGHRNMFGIAFDNKGVGIVTENGHAHYDEINKIEKGGNYGWPIHQPPNIAPELSKYSIKPLTSYQSVIIPTQAIFYDDDKIPELNGKFIFASYGTPSLHALQFVDNGEIVYEEIINANHTGPAISLAQSPDGYIYYGGSAIFILESVNVTPKLQIKFPLEIVGNIDLNNLKLNKDEKQMVVDITTHDSPTLVTIKIPKVLLDGIFSVTDEKQEVDFTVESSQDHNMVNMSVTSKGNSKLVISGTAVIPEFSTSAVVIMFIALSFVAGILLIKKDAYLQ